jgi:hypothetical protein
MALNLANTGLPVVVLQQIAEIFADLREVAD